MNPPKMIGKKIAFTGSQTYLESTLVFFIHSSSFRFSSLNRSFVSSDEEYKTADASFFKDESDDMTTYGELIHLTNCVPY